MAVTSDAGKVHIFDIGTAYRAKNNLKTVRKNEIKSCMTIAVDQLLKDCNLPKKTTKTF